MSNNALQGWALAKFDRLGLVRQNKVHLLLKNKQLGH